MNRNKISFILISFYIGISYVSELAINYFLKDTFNVSPSMLTNILSLAKIPWIIKPLFGLITDFLPIFGYRRKYYILICGILISISLINLSFFTTTLLEAKLNLLLYNSSVSFISILGQTIIVELIQEDPKNSSLVTIDYLTASIGYLISSFLQGLLVEKFSIKFVFQFSAILPIFLITSGLLLIEKKINLNDEKKNNNNSNLLKELIQYLLQKKIIITLIYFMVLLSTPIYYDTLFYYYNNQLKFSPNDIGKINFYGTLLNIFLITIYNKYNWNKYTKIFLLTIKILSMLVCQMHYFVVNNNYLNYNISPYSIIFLSDSIKVPLIQMQNLPLSEITAELSPKNLEGTVHSLFVSVMNLSNMIGSLLGSWLNNYYNISQNNFDNLGKLIKFCNYTILIPIIYIILLPDKYMKPKSEKKIN